MLSLSWYFLLWLTLLWSSLLWMYLSWLSSSWLSLPSLPSLPSQGVKIIALPLSLRNMVLDQESPFHTFKKLFGMPDRQTDKQTLKLYNLELVEWKGKVSSYLLLSGTQLVPFTSATDISNLNQISFWYVQVTNPVGGETNLGANPVLNTTG